jgi:hypothetical protein
MMHTERYLVPSLIVVSRSFAITTTTNQVTPFLLTNLARLGTNRLIPGGTMRFGTGTNRKRNGPQGRILKVVRTSVRK